MKKTIITLLMGLVAFPAVAQKQEDHVVRRGRHKSAVTEVITHEKKHWFSNIAIDMTGGKYNAVECYTNYSLFRYGETEPGYTATLEDDKEFVLGLRYELLYRTESFYVGPGVALLFGHHVSPALYLRAQYEFLAESNIRPFIGVAGGASFMGDNEEYENSYYVRLEDYGYAHQKAYRGFTSEYRAEVSGGIKPYLDFNLGFAFDMGLNTSLIIGGHFTLRPAMNVRFDIDDFVPEIESFTSTHSSYSYPVEWSFPVEAEGTYRLYSGVELTLRF